MKVIAIIAALLVTACGVDGPPERPSPRLEQQVGVSVTGDARFGVQASL
ncbi:hypothetical protein [Paracoccus tegillarcae]|nr:hypothetical protein [Paracoccus tegillarcae]